MKAIAYHRYGSPDVLQLEETEKPTAGDHEVLIKVSRHRTGRSVDWSSGSRYQSACVVSVREPEPGSVYGEAEQGGPHHHVRAHGGRKGDTGHRQALQVERGRRGNPRMTGVCD